MWIIPLRFRPWSKTLRVSFASDQSKCPKKSSKQNKMPKNDIYYILYCLYQKGGEPRNGSVLKTVVNALDNFDGNHSHSVIFPDKL